MRGIKMFVEFVPWEDRYKLGLDIVDVQHRELIRLTNELFTDCRQGKTVADEGFQKTVKAVVEYVTVHFSTEEKIMERVSYPQIAEHIAEHRLFAKTVLVEVKNFEDGKSFVPNTFARFLREWVLNHIAITDKKIGDYIFSMKKEGLLDHTLQAS